MTSETALLTPEEQACSIAEYQKTRSPQLEARLVASHLRLVWKMAREHRPSDEDLADIIQEGSLGLLQAVRKFDPSRGVTLASYAAWWIRAYQLRWLVANHRLVRLGTTVAQRKLFFKLRSLTAELEARGEETTDAALAARLGVREEDVVSMRLRLGSRELSLDAGVGEEGAALERLASPGPSPDEVSAEAELRALVRDEAEVFRDSLSGRDRDLFDTRWASDDEAPTLKALGQRFGISRERTRQLEQRILGLFRQRLEHRLGHGFAA